jgi:hypothetical protein
MKGRPMSRGQDVGSRAFGSQSGKPRMRISPPRPKPHRRRSRPRSFANNLRSKVNAQGQDTIDDDDGDSSLTGGDGTGSGKPIMHAPSKTSKRAKGAKEQKVTTKSDTSDEKTEEEGTRRRSRPFGGRVWKELESLKALNTGD